MHEPPFEPAEVASQDSLADDGTPVAAPRISLHSIVWSVVLSLVVLGVIGYFTFEPETFGQMLHINPWLLGAAGLTVVLRVFFGSWRLNHVSHGRLGWLGALRGQLAWDFFSNVTPSTIGGGPIASAYIARDNHLPLGEATSIVLFSMLLDQIWFTLAIPTILVLDFYLEIIPNSLGTVGSWTVTVYFLIFMSWVLLFGYSTLVRPHLLEKLVDRVCRIKRLHRFREHALNVMGQLQHRAHILRTQRPWFYLKGFLLSLASWVNRYLLVVFILWSVYPALDKVLVLLRTVTLMLGAVVLPTPGGAGGIEGLYVLMIGPLIPDALLVPTLLTWRLMGYYIFVALGAYLTVHQVHKTIRRKKNERALAAHNGAASSNGAPVAQASESVEGNG